MTDILKKKENLELIEKCWKEHLADLNVPPKNEGYSMYEKYFRHGDAIEGRKAEFADLVEKLMLQYDTIKKGACALDLACGAGYFLESLDAKGVNAYGVEIDCQLSQIARNEGRRVFTSSNLDILPKLLNTGCKFDLITAFHIVEHMDPDSVELMIKKYSDLLVDGGLMVIVLPEFSDDRVQSESFYRDPTHIRPYPADLISYYMSFCKLKVVYTAAFDKHIPVNQSGVSYKRSILKDLDKLSSRLATILTGDKQ